VTSFEFRPDIHYQKTRVPGLSCTVVCMILSLAILIQYWHTRTHAHTHACTQTHTHAHAHAHTHTHTDTCTQTRTHSDGIYCVRTASHGKKMITWPHPFQGQFVIHRLGLAVINLHTKLEVSKNVHPPRRYERQCKNVEIWVVWRVRGHPRSPWISLFDTEHTTSYSNLIESMHLSCTAFEL